MSEINGYLKFAVAEVCDVMPQRKSRELKQAAKQAVRAAWEVDVHSNPILQAWRELFDPLHEVASPQLLLELALRSGRLPRINTLDGACNLVSLGKLVVVSAHDLDKIEGEPRLIVTTGNEIFHPLGAEVPETLPAREWAVVAGKRVLSHLDCKQSALTNVTPETRNVLVCVLGNRATSAEYVDAALRRACAEVVRYNGGRAMLE